MVAAKRLALRIFLIVISITGLAMTARSGAATLVYATFIAGGGGDGIVKIDPAGIASHVIGGGQFSALTVDNFGNLYAAYKPGGGGSSIWRIDPAGNTSPFQGGFYSSLAADSSGNIYASFISGGGGDGIVKIDPSGNTSHFQSGL